LSKATILRFTFLTTGRFKNRRLSSLGQWKYASGESIFRCANTRSV